MADVRTWRVPGRVNLIGEHLDHNGGMSLPFAIDRGLTVKARARDDDTVNVWSAWHGGRTAGGEQQSRKATFTVGEQTDDWAALVAGVVRAVPGARGADLVVESDLPPGAGLSSSAALSCGVACAFDDLGSLGLSRMDVAKASQQAEHEASGAPTGLMDQLAVLHGRAGHAVLVDCGTDPPSVREVPLDVDPDGLALMVIVTGASHEHGTSGYADRRRECQEAADALGLDRLVDAGPDAILRLEDETLKARTRHVITETARVRGALRAIEARAWSQLGTMLTASHASLRDDFEVSCAELDVAVDATLEAGALGARMTGGGFGGSAVALVPRDVVPRVRERVERQYEQAEWSAPEVFVVRPSDGARLLD